MLNTFAVSNYRSLLDLTLPLGQLNLIVGANGSGKSNLYRALRLLATTGQRGIVYALAQEGGLSSALWAGPETLTKGMKSGEIPVQGLIRTKPIRLNLGFNSLSIGYGISLGMPASGEYPFTNEALIRREVIWSGGKFTRGKVIVERTEHMMSIKSGRNWQVLSSNVPCYLSIFDAGFDAASVPELSQLREHIRQWRFYDVFRTDPQSPARQPQLGTMTPIVAHDGSDLAAALMTIDFIGDSEAMHNAIDRAFAGSELVFAEDERGYVSLALRQPGLLRPLSAQELSEGTLRYLFWVAALLSPRPAPLIVLNEPETSLHPDLLPALASLILQATEHSQVWVISHANRLINALVDDERCVQHTLEKPLGETEIAGQTMMNEPSWAWPPKFGKK